MSKAKIDSSLFEGFSKKQAPIQTATLVKERVIKKDNLKEVPLMITLPQDFKDKLEIYKVTNNKKSLKAVIIEALAPVIGYGQQH